MTTTTARVDGAFYWVRRERGGAWVIAQFCQGRFWQFVDDREEYCDDDLAEIGPRALEPDPPDHGRRSAARQARRQPGDTRSVPGRRFEPEVAGSNPVAAHLQMICLACRTSGVKLYVSAVCAGCWFELPNETRRRLDLADGESRNRLFQLMSALRREVALSEITVSA